MTPLLVGTDGSKKMSKSLGNYIGVAEPPETIYGKTMSIRDDLILTYFELVTDVPSEELAEFKKQLENNTVNPMVLKKRLAREIVAQLYGEKEAATAGEHFNKVVQKKELPDEIQEYPISFSPFRDSSGQIHILRLLTATGVAASSSEVSRLIDHGAVEMDGQIIPKKTIYLMLPDISNFKVGKHRFIKIKNTDNIA